MFNYLLPIGLPILLIPLLCGGCGGFIALISSREEGGAIADLLIVRHDNKVNGSCDDDVYLVPAIL